MPGRTSALPLPVIFSAAFVFIFCSLFSWLVFEHVPHVNDEIANLFQARLFLSGKLYAPSPCAAEFFDFPHVINNGRWYSIYPPGFPFLLLLGLLVRAPWIINPILASLAVFLFFKTGKEIYDEKIGALAAVLGAVSIWHLLMSSTMMSHTASMFFNTLFLMFFSRSLKKPSFGLGAAAGASLGLAFLIRPTSALLFSLPFLVYYLIFVFKDLKFRLRNALAFALTAFASASILLVYNLFTNGNPFLMGYIVRYGKSYSVIFGRAATMDFAYTPHFAALQLWDNLKALNTDLFGWPFSSFLAILPLLWLSRLKPKDRKKDLLLSSGILGLVVGFYFFWGAFVFIGARMFFDALPLFLLLSARGVTEFQAILGKSSRKLTASAARKITAVLLSVLVLYAFVYRFPRFIRPPHGGWYQERYDHRFAGTTARLHQTLASLDLGRALVILKFLHRPPRSFSEEGGWGSGFIHNDPEMQGQVIYARARDRSLAELFACHPKRKIFLYIGTLDKGVLLPLRKEGEKIIRGDPLRSRKRSGRSLGLLQTPRQIFSDYSQEFRDFLVKLFQDHDLAELDGRRLEELGRLHHARGEFRQAAFCLEAALQIENDPETRRNLLGLLISCYQRSGQTEAAGKIIKFMENVGFNEKKYYAVFPERGF